MPATDNSAELAAIADVVLDMACPGEQLELAAARSETTSVRVHGAEVEALTVADVSGIGVRVLSGGRQGFASAGSLDADVIREVVAEARDNMAFAEPDEHVRLVRPDGVEAVETDLWDDSVKHTSIDDKVAMAVDLERRVVEADPRITGVRTARYGDRAGNSIIANTSGVTAHGRSTSASLGVLALARDADGTQSGAGSDVARGPLDLDVATAAAEAVSRSTALLGAVQPSSGRVTLVLEPRLGASLLGIIGGMLSGERVLKGRTPFADRIGERIAHPSLTMADDPTNPESYGASSHDGEGLATRPNPLLVDGVLQQYLYHSVSASRANTASTASAVRGVRSTPGVGWHALAVAPGTQSLDELIASVDEGLFVHSMAGLHSGVNAVSGDFSVGAEGIMIRNGELAEPVREATIASTLPRLLHEIVGLGAEVEHLAGGVSCPAMVVANVSLGGAS